MVMYGDSKQELHTMLSQYSPSKSIGSSQNPIHTLD